MTTTAGVVAFSFPNPVSWVVDKVTGFVGGVATAGFEMLIGGLVAWVLDAVIWVVGGVFNFFMDSTDPNVQADWFSGANSPYATTATIAATLMVGFLLAGVVQGTMSGDTAGMIKRIAIDLPVSVLGMVGLVAVTQALVALTDALSGDVLSRFQDDISSFSTIVGSLAVLGGGTATAFVVLLLGLVTVIAGVILLAELVIRAALIYIVVALAPLVFAARLWPALQGACRKLLELLCALILSKLVIAVALAVASAAAAGAGSGGEVTALPEPEVFAEDPEGSVTQAVGILLTAAAAFGVSAFSPMLLMRLLPLAEGALVAQGIRGGPNRGLQQGMSMAYAARFAGSTATRVAAGPVGAATAASSAGGTGAAGGFAGPGAPAGAPGGGGGAAGRAGRATAYGGGGGSPIDTTGSEAGSRPTGSTSPGSSGSGSAGRGAGRRPTSPTGSSPAPGVASARTATTRSKDVGGGGR